MLCPQTQASPGLWVPVGVSTPWGPIGPFLQTTLSSCWGPSMEHLITKLSDDMLHREFNKG